MRCSMCGHESPPGSSFCLNCGSSLTAGAQAFAQTPSASPGLPSICAVCRGENPPGMKFCRSCGAALQAAPAFAAGHGAMPPPGPLPMPGAAVGPMPGMQGGPMGGFPSAPASPYGGGGPVGGMPGGPISSGPLGGPVGGGPFGGAPHGGGPHGGGPVGGGPVGGMPGMGHDPTMLPPMPAARPAQPTTACPRCGTQTPLGFAFCQQCGFHMQTAEPAGRGAPSPGVIPAPGQHDAPIDPHAGTLAQPDDVRISINPPKPAAGAAWGTAVLVNRDGSDGQRFALSGEYVVVGRAGSDVAFDEDRFLARQHARFERAGDGSVKVVALDALNGVFRKADAPVELADGTTILIGREVLRFERVAPEETKVVPLVRHNVALFGSPPREPWGRFIQLIPSGGYRDVRHLAGEEIVLGREEGDLVFRDDAFLSRRHAAVTWDGKRVLLTDLGSSNGTFVRITAPTALRHGDHVRMGDQLLRLELR